VRHKKIKIKEVNRVKKRQRLSQKRVRLSVFNDSIRMKIPSIRNGAVNDALIEDIDATSSIASSAFLLFYIKYRL
jgi:hypothetical protein